MKRKTPEGSSVDGKNAKRSKTDHQALDLKRAGNKNTKLEKDNLKLKTELKALQKQFKMLEDQKKDLESRVNWMNEAVMNQLTEVKTAVSSSHEESPASKLLGQTISAFQSQLNSIQVIHLMISLNLFQGSN